VRAVIELKGTDTSDLLKVQQQAFNYKNNQKGCTYVITSNFEKLRFYINDATEYEEFHLFSLSEERFALLYLCLQKDQLLAETKQMNRTSSGMLFLNWHCCALMATSIKIWATGTLSIRLRVMFLSYLRSVFLYNSKTRSIYTIEIINHLKANLAAEEINEQYIRRQIVGPLRSDGVC
jgi:hypothetical protein